MVINRGNDWTMKGGRDRPGSLLPLLIDHLIQLLDIIYNGSEDWGPEPPFLPFLMGGSHGVPSLIDASICRNYVLIHGSLFPIQPLVAPDPISKVVFLSGAPGVESYGNREAL